MGRYTTVQAYSDTNQNTRSVSYEQATGSAAAKSGAVRAEKVDNPYGSTAGAGSGEFHVYRHARAREMARMRQLDEEEAEQKADAEFKEKVSAWKTEEEQRTEKRRKKRQREKEAKLRKKNMKLGGVGFENGVDDGPAKVNNGQEEEFEYTPTHKAQREQGKGDETESKLPDAPSANQLPIGSAAPAAAFANDGSFLELMKKQFGEEDSAGEKSVENQAKTKHVAEQTIESEQGINVVSTKQD